MGHVGQKAGAAVGELRGVTELVPLKEGALLGEGAEEELLVDVLLGKGGGEELLVLVGVLLAEGGTEEELLVGVEV